MNEIIEFHIGGYNVEVTKQAKRELLSLLNK
jgi:hypothetical protein